MSLHLHRDMDDLHQEVLALCSLVEDMLDKAASVLRERRFQLADEVAAADDEVDRREVQIEEDCLKILALHQPVAVDLRRVVMMLKINNDLERIADLAVNVASRGRSLADHPDFVVPDRLLEMAAAAAQMLREALNAFVNLDVDASRRILTADDEVDQHNVEVITSLQQQMQTRSDWVAPALHCFSASRHIERIADLATNVAEDVIYLVEGEIVRHKQNIEFVTANADPQ